MKSLFCFFLSTAYFILFYIIRIFFKFYKFIRHLFRLISDQLKRKSLRSFLLGLAHRRLKIAAGVRLRNYVRNFINTLKWIKFLFSNLKERRREENEKKKKERNYRGDERKEERKGKKGRKRVWLCFQLDCWQQSNIITLKILWKD